MKISSTKTVYNHSESRLQQNVFQMRKYGTSRIVFNSVCMPSIYLLICLRACLSIFPSVFYKISSQSNYFWNKSKKAVSEFIALLKFRLKATQLPYVICLCKFVVWYNSEILIPYRKNNKTQSKLYSALIFYKDLLFNR